MVLVAKPMFSVMRNHLEPISEAPDRSEGQELSMYQVGVTGGCGSAYEESHIILLLGQNTLLLQHISYVW